MPEYQTSPVTVIADGAYNSFPNLAAENADGTGKLFCVYRKGVSHTTVDGKIVLKTSSDSGATWSAETVLATPIALHDYRDPGIVRTSTGRLLVSTFDYDGTNSRGLMTMYSDNAGVSWSSLSSLIIPYTGADKGASTSPILQHSTGTLVWPIYGENSGDAGIGAGVLRSTDNGVSWGSVVAVTTNIDHFSEMTLTELPDTSIMALLREDEIIVAPPVSIFRSNSSDVGLTWSAAATLGFTTRPGKPMAVLSRVASFIYLWYRKVSTNHCVWRFSRDLGVTWSTEQTYSTNVYEYAGGTRMGGELCGFVVAFDNGANRADIQFTSLAT